MFPDGIVNIELQRSKKTGAKALAESVCFFMLRGFFMYRIKQIFRILE